MLKIANDLSSYKLAAGEPFLFELQLKNNVGAVIDTSARKFALVVYKSPRQVLQTLEGQLLSDGTHQFLRFAADGSFSEGLSSQSAMQIELSEIYHNGRNVLATGTLTIAPSAQSLPSFDTTDEGDYATRTTIQFGADGVSMNFSQAYVPFVVNAPPSLTGQAITPGSGYVGDEFEVSDGTIIGGAISARQWLLNGTAISGANGATYLAAAAGALACTVTAIGLGGSNSVTTQSVTVSPPPPIYIPLFLTHADSRGAGIYAAQQQDGNYTRAQQFVMGDRGSPLPTGLTSTLFPLENHINYSEQNGINYLSPMHYAQRAVVDAFARSPVVVMAGNAHNGQTLTGVGHTMGPLPDSQTAAGIAKAGAAYTAVQNAYPTGVILPMIVTIDVTNDLDQGADPATVKAAKAQQLLDLRTASGFSSAPIVVASTLPEDQALYNPLVETAQRIAALKTPNTYYVAMPSGITSDNIHEGKAGNPDDLTGVRTGGHDYIGRVMLVAYGKAAPRTPTVTVVTSGNVTEGTSTPVGLGISEPAYWSIDAATSDGSGALNPDLFALSPDVELATQQLRPAGGAWPAYDAGTPANNVKRVKLNYITGDRVTGSVTVTRTITQTVIIPYLAYDDFNRADVAADFNALGVTSGHLGYGGGLTWIGAAGIASNQLTIGETDYTPVKCYAWVDVGTGEVVVSATVVMAGNKPFRLFAAAKHKGTFDQVDSETDMGSRVVLSTDGALNYIDSGGSTHQIGTFADMGYSGTHTVSLKVKTENGVVNAHATIDGVEVASGAPMYGAIDITGHYAGVGVDYANFALRADDFSVLAA